jgi:DNA-binding IclR family transcriptional regulator
MLSREQKVRGTQGIQRAAQILRAVASRGRNGARLIDLSEQTQLEQPTARRILKSLIAEGIIIQDPASRRYMLDHLVLEVLVRDATEF